MAMNSNTMKNGRNPETHETLDELRVLKPIEIDLDSDAYRMPAVPEKEAP